MSTTTPQRPSYLDTLDCVITETIAPLAVETDQAGAYPRAAVEALGKAGLLGLISAQDVGGLGEAHRAATLVIEEIGKYCASTAMIVCMHYAGTAVIEAYGPREVREAIAAGQHVTTLAAGTTRMLTQTPTFDHCNFTVVSTAPAELVALFQSLLIDMSYDDPEVRPLCDLEGLQAWYPGRGDGYQALETAVELAGFYDQQGDITATDYSF